MSSRLMAEVDYSMLFAHLHKHSAIAKEKQVWHALLLENLTVPERLVLDMLLLKLNRAPV